VFAPANASLRLLKTALELDKVAIETPVPGLRLILGALGHTGKAETTAEQHACSRAVRKLPADLDLDLAPAPTAPRSIFPRPTRAVRRRPSPPRSRTLRISALPSTGSSYELAIHRRE
jgi:hypothetical protein